MAEKRDRKLISLNGDEYRKLSALKETFETWNGEMTWGQFLINATTPAASSSGMVGELKATIIRKDDRAE